MVVEPWTGLLETAALILDELPPSFRDGLSVGGGSMLAGLLKHRISHDLDFFHRDPQAIGFLTPRLNHRMEALGLPYTEQSNFLKFVKGTQEIDLIIALPVTEQGTSGTLPVGRGILVARETPTEIMAKKILYRGSQTIARDLYDLAALESLAPRSLDALATRVGRKALRGMLDRVKQMRPTLPNALNAFVTPTPSWKAFHREVPDLAIQALERLECIAARAMSERLPER